MAFALRNLSVLAYANGFTLWHYKAGNEDKAAMSAASYFNEAGDMLCAGDIVLVSSATGARILCVTPDARGPRMVPLQA